MSWLNRISPLHLQLTAHITYILLSYSLITELRSMWTIFFLYALCAGFLYLTQRLQWIQHKPTLISLFVVANSLYLNIYVHRDASWAIYVALIIALLAKYFLRTNNGRLPYFNASIFAVFILSMTTPQYVNYAGYSWDSPLWASMLVFLIGTLVTWHAKTIAVAAAYYIGYSLSAVLFHALLRQLLPESAYAQTDPVHWFVGLSAFSSLLFTFHVITDPQTCPRSTPMKLAFGCLIGFLEMSLRSFFILNASIVAYMTVLLVHAVLRETHIIRRGQPIIQQAPSTLSQYRVPEESSAAQTR